MLEASNGSTSASVSAAAGGGRRRLDAVRLGRANRKPAKLGNSARRAIFSWTSGAALRISCSSQS